MKETWREMKKKVVVVELLCYVQLFATPWTVAHQAPLSSTVSWSLLKFILSLWCYLTISSSAILFFCLQSFPASGSSPVNQLFSPGDQSIGASASASVFPMSVQDFSRDQWFDLFAVQGTLKSLLQHRSSKPSILWRSAFFTVQLSHPYMTTGKTIALIRWTLFGKVMSLLLNYTI